MGSLTYLVSIGRSGFRGRLSSQPALLLWHQPEDRLQWAVEIRRQAQRELDRGHIATDFESQDGMARDLQIGGELFLCQPVLLPQLPQTVDDDSLHGQSALSPRAPHCRRR